MSVLHIVHCIDTEGPLKEDLADTFARVKSVFGVDVAPTDANLALLQQQKLPAGGHEAAIARMLAPELLAYNENWQQIDAMLDEAMSPDFRKEMVDDAGRGWVYSWHCMDHAGYASNPRHKDTGWGSVIQFYTRKIAQTRSQHDEINWHFHPLSFTRNPLQCATSYVNSYDVLVQVLSRRVIEEGFFPVVNRPGFHSERPDSHAFLEQWIPFDYANQVDDSVNEQADLNRGRLGDWRRASPSWRGYRPHHDDYQIAGDCRRWIFRCLNVGTRIRCLTMRHVAEAFAEAEHTGSAILAFADHDYRDIRPDVRTVRDMLAAVKPRFPSVEMRFSGAREAAVAHVHSIDGKTHAPLQLSLSLEGEVLHVRVTQGTLFGPQPFLAIRAKTGSYLHDNFDVQEWGKHYTYIFDNQTLPLAELAVVGVGSAGMGGSSHVATLTV
jgi:hypothetical protein